MRFVRQWWAGSVRAKGVTTKDAKVHEGLHLFLAYGFF